MWTISGLILRKAAANRGIRRQSIPSSPLEFRHGKMGVAQQSTQNRIRTLAEDEDSHPVSAIGLGARDVHDQSLGAAHLEAHENMRDRQRGAVGAPRFL